MFRVLTGSFLFFLGALSVVFAEEESPGFEGVRPEHLVAVEYGNEVWIGMIVQRDPDQLLPRRLDSLIPGAEYDFSSFRIPTGRLMFDGNEILWESYDNPSVPIAKTTGHFHQVTLGVPTPSFIEPVDVVSIEWIPPVRLELSVPVPSFASDYELQIEEALEIQKRVLREDRLLEEIHSKDGNPLLRNDRDSFARYPKLKKVLSEYEKAYRSRLEADPVVKPEGVEAQLQLIRRDLLGAARRSRASPQMNVDRLGDLMGLYFRKLEELGVAAPGTTDPVGRRTIVARFREIERILEEIVVTLVSLKGNAPDAAEIYVKGAIGVAAASGLVGVSSLAELYALDYSQSLGYLRAAAMVGLLGTSLAFIAPSGVAKKFHLPSINLLIKDKLSISEIRETLCGHLNCGPSSGPGNRWRLFFPVVEATTLREVFRQMLHATELAAGIGVGRLRLGRIEPSSEECGPALKE